MTDVALGARRVEARALSCAAHAKPRLLQAPINAQGLRGAWEQRRGSD
jgi:hypothetical protein